MAKARQKCTADPTMAPSDFGVSPRRYRLDKEVLEIPALLPPLPLDNNRSNKRRYRFERNLLYNKKKRNVKERLIIVTTPHALLYFMRSFVHILYLFTFDYFYYYCYYCYMLNTTCTAIIQMKEADQHQFFARCS